MPLPLDKLLDSKVEFSLPVDVQIIAIDGTWRRPCKLNQVSSDAASLTIKNVQTLLTKEFFLVLSTRGKAYRRCELEWVNGDQIGVRFLKANDAKQPGRNEAG